MRRTTYKLGYALTGYSLNNVILKHKKAGPGASEGELEDIFRSMFTYEDKINTPALESICEQL